MKDTNIRSFLALEIPEEAQEQLYNLILKWQRLNLGKIKWVSAKNMHITLKFLGEINQEQKEKIINILKQSLIKIESFNIKLSGLGIFPNWNRPRVLWAGLTEGIEESNILFENVEETLFELDFEPERNKYHPHITLARIKFLKDKEKHKKFVEIIKNANFTYDKIIPITRIVLMKSTLTPSGAIYEPLEFINLMNTSFQTLQPTI